MAQFPTIPESNRPQIIRANQKNILPYGVKNWNVDSITAEKITTGTLTAVETLGGGEGLATVVIDGVNNRILITDETGTPRILIGKS